MALFFVEKVKSFFFWDVITQRREIKNFVALFIGILARNKYEPAKWVIAILRGGQQCIQAGLCPQIILHEKSDC